MRINRYMADCGLCSRREADRLIEEKRVMVNGLPAAMGMDVREGDSVFFDGKPVIKTGNGVILAVNKPRGIVCTTARYPGEKNIVDMINYPSRVFPVGRLDKPSEGLILMTDIGDIANRILRSENGHEKEYEAVIDRPVTERFIKAMSAGVDLDGTMTLPCKVKKTGQNSFDIILTQGMNRQIRRMCEKLGCRIRALRRVRIMNICLGNLPPGHYRHIEGAEKEELMRRIKKGGRTGQ